MASNSLIYGLKRKKMLENFVKVADMPQEVIENIRKLLKNTDLN